MDKHRAQTKAAKTRSDVMASCNMHLLSSIYRGVRSRSYSPHMVALKLPCPLKAPSFPYITIGMREKGESVAGKRILLMFSGLAMLAKSRTVFSIFGLMDIFISKYLRM